MNECDFDLKLCFWFNVLWKPNRHYHLCHSNGSNKILNARLVLSLYVCTAAE